MADETKNSNEIDSGENEIIDLEGLVRDIDLTPTGPISAAAAEATSAGHAILHPDALSHDEIDAILVEEDPSLASEIDSIRAVVIERADSSKALELDELGHLKNKDAMSFRQRIGFQFLKIGSGLRSFKGLFGRGSADSNGVFRELVVRLQLGLVGWLHNRKAELGKGFAWIKSRRTPQKIALVLTLFALAGLFFVSVRTIQGTLLPKTEKAWVANFADHADGTFKYDASGATEDFNDPLLHPEFVVLIERVVVNLSRTPEARESANPMAAFELYLQTDTQESAIEIKDRNVEIRDAISRSVERMTYPELAEEDGKTKLKLLIRKDLNEILTRGKVRRVFFKTIVLNPEE